MSTTGFKDVPVGKINEDQLKVKVFVESLSEFIMGCDTPMTIAIQGDWGSGKTSMMNMVREHLGGKADTLWFNTWQYSQFQQDAMLPVSILSSFLTKLDKPDEGRQLFKRLGSGIMSAAKFAAMAAIEKGGGQATAEGVSRAFFDEDVTEELLTLKEKITKAVENRLNTTKRNRLVVFVDDLDRLQPARAVELLEVMKLFMDVEKCVFLLAVDYGVVIQGIRIKYGGEMEASKGRSFFDKIIQLPFNVPIAHYDVMEYIRQFLTTLGIPASDQEIDHYRRLLETSIGFNPRSLKRIFNTFTLLRSVAGKKDQSTRENPGRLRVLFGVLCMQMEHEPLYRYLVGNLDDVTEDIFNYFREKRFLRPDNADKRIVDVFKNDTKALNNASEFMGTLFDVMQLDGDQRLSDEELDILKSTLSFSAITAKSGGIDSQASRTWRSYGKLSDYIDQEWKNHKETSKGPLACLRATTDFAMEALGKEGTMVLRRSGIYIKVPAIGARGGWAQIIAFYPKVNYLGLSVYWGADSAPGGLRPDGNGWLSFKLAKPEQFDDNIQEIIRLAYARYQERQAQLSRP